MFDIYVKRVPKESQKVEYVIPKKIVGIDIELLFKLQAYALKRGYKNTTEFINELIKEDNLDN